MEVGHKEVGHKCVQESPASLGNPEFNRIVVGEHGLAELVINIGTIYEVVHGQSKTVQMDIEFCPFCGVKL